MGNNAAAVDELLKPAFVDGLMAFARSEHNDENLQFILDVKGGKDKKAVYNTYVAKNARKPINISSAAKAELDKNATTNKWERLNFDPAVTEVKQLFARDSLKRYWSCVDAKKCA
jgi:hypothetical protein